MTRPYIHKVRSIVLVALAGVLTAGACARAQEPGGRYFGVSVIDDQTGRGVPQVELQTVNNVRYITDSNGMVAIDEPSFVGKKLYFTVKSDGYEFPADGFGMRGKALEIKPGQKAELKIRRVNIAQRLYRMTGEGIYRDSVMLGIKPPTAAPLLNGMVLGQDSVQSIIYRGQIHWFWGDTNKPSYPLGHFGTAGAVSDLPDKGGLDPNVGVNLKYFVDAEGFSRPMVPWKEPGMKWIEGLMLLNDQAGKERLVMKYAAMKTLSEMLDCGLAIYDDATDAFTALCHFPVHTQVCPNGHPFKLAVDGVDYYCFPTPYPMLRVKADLKAVQDQSQYQAFTCLASGSRYSKTQPKLDRDAAGKLLWDWKANTDPISQRQEDELVKAGHIKPAERWFVLKDVASGQPVTIHSGGSVHYNRYRQAWIMIGVQAGGKSSYLGEVFFAQSKRPEGPWKLARQIATHDKYSFYNPKQHPFFDQEDGKIIYFEGTYTITFSGRTDPTPRYEYNQMMYKLDLSDERLKMPAE